MKISRATLHDRGIPLLVGLLFTMVVLWAHTTSNTSVQTFVQRLENLAYDFRLRSLLPWQKKIQAPVVILDIDERSLQEEGRWPWPREKVAAVVEKLFAAGTVVVGFDVIFSEPQLNMADQVFVRASEAKDQFSIAETLKHTLLQEFDHDQHLANSLAAGDVVLGVLLHNEDSAPVGQLPEPLMQLSSKSVLAQSLAVPEISSYSANIPLLQEAAVGGGFVTTIRDSDGVIRRTPLLMRHGNDIYGALSLEVARVYLLAEKFALETHQVGEADVLEKIKLDAIEIPTDQQGQVLVPFIGKRESYPYLSATDLLNDKIDTTLLENAIVLVGTSALGLGDLPSTAVQGVFPGVEIHANNINGILNQHFPIEPVWAHGANFVLILFSGLILTVLFSFLGPLHIAWISLTVLALEIGLNTWLWLEHSIVVAIILPISLVVGLVIIDMTYGFLFENRRKKQMTAMFGQYVSSDIVEEMSNDPDNYSFDGKSLEMSVLFADIRSFTSISESLTAAQLKDLLNRYFEPMTEIIFNNHGTIDKYVGDMIMAFWGAPKEDPQQATHSVLAALQMQQKTAELKLEFAALHLPEVNIGVGINTGVMNVGDMGSVYRRAYTVLGDNVNLGSRLEASTKFYGAKILIGEKTKTGATSILCRKMDLVRVKGKKTAVPIYEPLVLEAEASVELKQELALHHEAIELYSAREFQQAAQIFAQLRQQHPETLIYEMYEQRIADFIHHPPAEDWDGSYTRTDK